jgi:hypothetical protein
VAPGNRGPAHHPPKLTPDTDEREVQARAGTDLDQGQRLCAGGGDREEAARQNRGPRHFIGLRRALDERRKGVAPRGERCLERRLKRPLPLVIGPSRVDRRERRRGAGQDQSVEPACEPERQRIGPRLARPVQHLAADRRLPVKPCRQ